MAERLTDADLAALREATLHFQWLDERGGLTREEESHVAALAKVPLLLAEVETLRREFNAALAEKERVAVDALTVDGEAMDLAERLAVVTRERDEARVALAEIESIARTK